MWNVVDNKTKWTDHQYYITPELLYASLAISLAAILRSQTCYVKVTKLLFDLQRSSYFILFGKIPAWPHHTFATQMTTDMFRSRMFSPAIHTTDCYLRSRLGREEEPASILARVLIGLKIYVLSSINESVNTYILSFHNCVYETAFPIKRMAFLGCIV